MDSAVLHDNRMQSLIALFDMHTKFYYNVLDGISDKDTHNRLNTKANHVAWIAGSLVYERFNLVNVMSLESNLKPNDLTNELFKDYQGIKDNTEYPLIEVYKKDWEKITPVLRKALVDLKAHQLDGPDPYEMPGEKYTLYDTLCFMIDRESYCIGQLGLYRRLLGYEAMKYQ